MLALWSAVLARTWKAVVSMLLCRRHERAARRRPEQENRGVDVFVPLDDGRIDVYRSKRFRPAAEPQGSGARSKTSYATLVQAVAEGHFAVRNWYLD